MKPKRLISLLVAVCMVVAMLPVSVFAEDTSSADLKNKGRLENNNSSIIKISEPGIYEMSGTYKAPIDVTADGEVIINITGNVDYTNDGTGRDDAGKKYTWTNYAIRAMNPNGTVTINNNGHTFTVNGDTYCGVVRAYSPDNKGPGHAVVNGGFYTSTNTTNGKELFYNYRGDLTLKNVHAEGDMLVKNFGGTVHIEGGSYKRTKCFSDAQINQTPIVNEADGTITMENVDVYAEMGSAFLNYGAKITITGGTFTTKDDTYAAILVDTCWDRTDGKHSGADDNSKKEATVEIDGATIEGSKRGIEVKDGKIIFKNGTFQGNESDIYLQENQNFDDVFDSSKYSGGPTWVRTSNTESHLINSTRLLTVEGGTITVDSTAVSNDKVEISKKDSTTTANVPVKSLVTVTFDKDAYADSDMVFSPWNISGLADAENYKNKESFTFEMPANNVTISAMPIPSASDDGVDAGTIVTVAVLGTGTAILAYHIGTEVYAEQVLGEDAVVPRTRGDVALKAWELAGKPAVVIDGEPLSEAAQAQRWVLESGLMQNKKDGAFHPEARMNKLKALRVLEKAQKLG